MQYYRKIGSFQSFISIMSTILVGLCLCCNHPHHPLYMNWPWKYQWSEMGQTTENTLLTTWTPAVFFLPSTYQARPTNISHNICCNWRVEGNENCCLNLKLSRNYLSTDLFSGRLGCRKELKQTFRRRQCIRKYINELSPWSFGCIFETITSIKIIARLVRKLPAN